MTYGEELTRAQLLASYLRLENWQLKAALGYPVPGDVPPGNFKCGLCEARDLLLARCYNVLTEQASQQDSQELLLMLEAHLGKGVGDDGQLRAGPNPADSSSKP